MDGSRIAVVTGGTRGIGLGICKALARERTRLALVYRADETSAESARSELEAAGSEVILIRADLSADGEAQKAVERVAAEWGALDILVNNAGAFRFAFLEEMDDDFLESLMAVNFKSMVRMIRSSLPLLKKSPHGRIVNASSISGRLADVGLIAYGCSKAGVDMMTRIAAAELAPWGITVNAYSPGIIATEMTRGMIAERGEVQVKQIPAGRFGAADDVGELVRFLCSPAAAYITGEIIGVDGGMFKVQNPFRAAEFARARGATKPGARRGAPDKGRKTREGT
jgi:3-oxoacyl-[acyl-carrier protein] reductase